jgi:AmmeMemoRadiSam system protein B
MKLSSNNASAATKDHPIHESIKEVDFESMNAVEDGSHADFLEQLENTGNTVCGRHPIGVFMAAVEASESTIASEKGRFKFLRYERSSKVKALNESSVSYCSAFAVL